MKNHKNSILKFKNITFSNHTLLLLYKESNALVTKNNIEYHLKNDSIIFIKKNSSLDISLQKKQSLKYILLSHEIMMETLKIIINKKDKLSPIKENDFIKIAHPEDILFFKKLQKQFNNELITIDKITLTQILKITYLLLGLNVANFILNEKTELISEKVKKIISSNIQHKWTLKEISSKLFISESSLRKKLEAEETNFMRLLTTIRMVNSMHLLSTTNLTIGEISLLNGYKNTSYFIKNFKKYYKISPKKLKKLKT
ncbi:TPA: helix-turn-helix transcriptional regulator [Escherichia coli]